MFSSQWNHVFSWKLGNIFNSWLATHWEALLATAWLLAHHWGFIKGSMTSPVFAHTPNLILWPCFPLKSPSILSSSSMFILASNRICPAKTPPFSLILPSSLKIFIFYSEFLFPHSKSLKSWAGVTLTAPVPKLISTNSGSAITFITRSAQNGC